MNRNKVGVVAGVVVVVFVVLSAFVWFIGSENPSTPAGYVGYLTQGSVFGKAKFYSLQTGPTSSGRTWLLGVTNVSITPYTYTEPFVGDAAVLAKDNLKLEFQAHSVFRVKPEGIKDFMEHFSVLISQDKIDTDPDLIVKNAYGNFIREPFRTFVRDEVQKRDVVGKIWLQQQSKEAFPDNRLQIVGYGQNRPVAENLTTSGRARNRRVEIVLGR